MSKSWIYLIILNNKITGKPILFFVSHSVPLVGGINLRTLRSRDVITMILHGRHHVSNHRQLDCFFNSLLRPTSMATWTLRITGLLRGKSTDDHKPGALLFMCLISKHPCSYHVCFRYLQLIEHMFFVLCDKAAQKWSDLSCFDILVFTQ